MAPDGMRLVGIMALALGAGAQAQPDGHPRWFPWEAQRTAIFFHRDQPGQPVQAVHVAAEVATTLLLPREVNPALTKLVGGEGRFEPLMIAGRSVVIVPVRDLAEGERFSLLVTLKDGTSIPLDLRAPRLDESTDGQVDVILDEEDPVAVRRALELARSRVKALTWENARHVQEGVSVDHAIAALLAQGRTDLTQFRKLRSWGFEDDKANIEVITFRPGKKGNDPEKAALVFHIRNKDSQVPWELDEVRLLSATTGSMKPFAFRSAWTVIEPGKTEAMAVVMDAEVFGSGRDDHLVLEIWRRTSGRPVRQAAIELVMVDDTTTPVSPPRSKSR